jgi:hypothetical protein
VDLGLGIPLGAVVADFGCFDYYSGQAAADSDFDCLVTLHLLLLLGRQRRGRGVDLVVVLLVVVLLLEGRLFWLWRMEQ